LFKNVINLSYFSIIYLEEVSKIYENIFCIIRIKLFAHSLKYKGLTVPQVLYT